MYQADWMKRLLIRYGQDMCLMDATYRVCRYVYASNPSVTVGSFQISTTDACHVNFLNPSHLNQGHPYIREPQKKFQHNISF